MSRPHAVEQRAGHVRRAATALGLLALVACFVIGSDLFGLREDLFGSATPPPKRSAFSRVVDESSASGTSGRPTVLRSQPWWQRVARRAGDGPATEQLRIDGGAIQWRVKARCSSGRLAIRASGAAPLVDTSCPARKVADAVGTGARTLEVTADGRWALEVEQQVDVPLDEPPLPAMSAAGAKPVMRGELYRIDQTATGRATIYRLASGRYALRLEHLYVTPNVDLELRLSPLPAPRTTRQFRSAPSAFLAPLDITAGSLNFLVPERVDPTRYRSLVVWCPPVVSAYGAATLRPGA